MKPYIYNLILAILAGTALIVPFTGKVHDARNKWYRKFTFRGWILFSAVVGSVIVTFLKDDHADRIEIAKNKLAETEKRKNDSIARKINNESNASIVTAFTNALAKHGLKYDSVEKVIQKLVKDSINKKTIIVSTIKPDIDINETRYLGYKNDSLSFSFQLVCKEAAAEEVNIKSQTILKRGSSYERLSVDKAFFPPNVKLSKNSVYLIRRPVVVNLRKLDLDYIYFHVTGYYFYDNVKYPIDQLIYYNFKTLESGIPGNKEEIINLFLK
ncbi:hypothetical protein G7092_24470 [Mucilaginibacter sp. HC2]|uniref:hypothetical protein n=1 Tax=Mucilaginibacter inviolabilis TaxID=2714892 RepID=UPI001407F469|nr:hypothetical protein [Mucilaginibacter inviolabilis]NHA06977.1 hypothetical protein [Mucilaginibacter inviolabilis]